MPFSDSCRLATILVFQFPLVGQITPLVGRTLLLRNFFFFFWRRALFLHFFLVRFLALRLRHAPWSQHPRVDAALRLHLVVARPSPRFHWTSRSHPLAANNVPASSAPRAAAFCCYRCAPAVPFCRCRSDSADLPASRRTTCTILQLLPGIQLSGVRLRTRGRLQFFNSAQVFQRCSDPPLPAGRLVPSRPSHVPTHARLIPRGRYLPCHIFHLGSLPLLVIVTVICPPTPRINSSISHHDFPFVKWSAKCCSPCTPASSLLFLIWSPPATMRISIQYVWCLSKSSFKTQHRALSPQVGHHRLHSETFGPLP